MKNMNWKHIVLLIFIAYVIVHMGMFVLAVLIKVANIGIVKVILTAGVTYVLLQLNDAEGHIQQAINKKK